MPGMKTPQKATWGFPNKRGTFLGVPITRTIIFWGLYWGPPILGNYHFWENMACHLPCTWRRVSPKQLIHTRILASFSGRALHPKTCSTTGTLGPSFGKSPRLRQATNKDRSSCFKTTVMGPAKAVTSNPRSCRSMRSRRVGV